MKSKLVYHHNSIFLLTRSGESTRMTPTTARDYLLNFNDEKYCGAASDLSADLFLLDDPEISVIAEVDDNMCLLVRDADAFRDIIVSAETNYLTVTEYAALHGKSVATVRRGCQNGRIPGAIRRGSVYLLPADAPSSSK